MKPQEDLSLGATCRADARCEFLVWAPYAERVDLCILGPPVRTVSMQAQARGYFSVQAEGVTPGTLYRYRLNGEMERPDPASRFQPQGVHGPSQVMDRRFDWQDQEWRGLPLRDFVLYEVHVGTFTLEGTCDAMIPRLAELRDLGITAIELMPVAQFPGSRNWGYDGVFPYAVQESYGGTPGLKRLVNACHRQGMAVVLDVVYNHLGPEGNYLADFGPYFTDAYRTPWGQAINLDGPQSDAVRRYFIENSLHWINEYHIDALRLDAVHAIVDPSARPFLEELGIAVHREGERLKRSVYLIPESDRNDARIVARREVGGLGLDAVWNDDFHHALHVLLTGETDGYYEDFGKMEHLTRAFSEGFVYSGQYSAFRRRRHGNSSRAIPAERLVVFAQNHDQVGNRRLGDRLASLVSFEGLKLAAGLVLLSPFLPLLFMGEEYGETAPFQYFVSHSDPALIEAVRRGRRQEFAQFAWNGDLPDPQDEATFHRSHLRWELRSTGQHRVLLDLYRELIRLRREIPVLARLDKKNLEAVAYENAKTLFLQRSDGTSEAFAVFHFGEMTEALALPVPAGCWQKRLDSTDLRWHGVGSELPASFESNGESILSLPAKSFVLFTGIRERI